MNTLARWRSNAVQLAESHENLITGALLLVGIILILVAVFGKSHHKAIAMAYIIL
jgi:uncharacterized YccA/Bax inhibitor family protein